MADSGPRVTIYRRYRRLIRAIEGFRELRIITAQEKKAMIEKVEALHEKWQEERRKKHPPGRAGRPGKDRTENGNLIFNVCQKQGCEKKPPAGQKYCSRDHAPYGHYGAGTWSHEE
jgi:hypothetical protein